MTAQFPERLHYDGRDYAMCTEPLSDFVAMGGSFPDFEDNCTALWRGYVGSWRIDADRLYLVGIRGGLRDGSDATLECVFPGYPERVFAHWYTGTLRCPRGRIVNYVHGGYASTYEADLFIAVRKGVVVGATLKSNVEGFVDVEEDAQSGVAAFTVFPRSRASDDGRGA